MYDRKNDPVRGSARNLFAAWCGRNRIRRPFSCERWFTLFEVTHLDGLHDVRQGRLMAAAPQPEATGRGAWQVPRRRSWAARGFFLTPERAGQP